MIPTPQQSAVIEEVANLDGDPITVSARAGSGKTKTLSLSAVGLPRARTGLAVAFNVLNKNDLRAAMPSQIDCKTLNGVGHGARILLGKRGILDHRRSGRQSAVAPSPASLSRASRASSVPG